MRVMSSWDYYRWKIQRELEKIAREFKILLDDLDRELFRPVVKEGKEIKEGFVYPEIEVHEGEDKIIVEIELPGVKREDLDLFVSEREIELTARRRIAGEVLGAKHAARRRIKKGYYLRLTLPSSVEVKRTKAKLEDGLLRITLPKKGGKGFKINVE